MRSRRSSPTCNPRTRTRESQAPAEIQPDLAVIIGFIGKLNNVLASDNYNLQAAAPQLESLAASTKLKQAGAHLKAWAAANCGA